MYVDSSGAPVRMSSACRRLIQCVAGGVAAGGVTVTSGGMAGDVAGGMTASDVVGSSAAGVRAGTAPVPFQWRQHAAVPVALLTKQ